MYPAWKVQSRLRIFKAGFGNMEAGSKMRRCLRRRKLEAGFGHSTPNMPKQSANLRSRLQLCEIGFGYSKPAWKHRSQRRTSDTGAECLKPAWTFEAGFEIIEPASEMRKLFRKPEAGFENSHWLRTTTTHFENQKPASGLRGRLRKIEAASKNPKPASITWAKLRNCIAVFGKTRPATGIRSRVSKHRKRLQTFGSSKQASKHETGCAYPTLASNVQ